MKTFTNPLKATLAFLLVFSAFNAKAQQHPMYSQYMFNMMNINPAYAGTNGVQTLTALYRDQWVGMPGSPKNTSLSYDLPINDKKIGVGVQFYNETLGIEKSTGVNASYAFKIPVSDNGTLSLGLQAGLLNYQARFTDVKTLEANDASFSQNINGIMPAAAAGIYYNTEKFYVGLSTPALLKTKLTLDNTADVSTATGKDLHLFLTTGYAIDLSEDLVLTPSVMVKAVSGAPVEVDFNGNLLIQNTLSLGFSYRTGDAIVGMAQIKLGDTPLYLGYAYDKTLTNLASYNRGSHEVMLRFEFGGRD